MTKTLTEQIVHIKNNWIDEKCTVPFFGCDTNASFKEGELVGKSNKDRQIERLEKQLAIATTALKYIKAFKGWQRYECEKCADNALKEMECVK